MSNQEQLVAEIAQEVIARLRLHLEGKAPAESKPKPAAPVSGGDGIFATVDEAVKAAAEAQQRVAEMGLEERGRIIAIIRRICEDRADEFGRMELEETKIGRLDHKIAKLHAMRHVVGVEAMRRVDARTRLDGPLRGRERALGRDRHDPAGHPLGADDGEQRHQHPRGGQHGDLQSASRGREGAPLTR